ncbi:hypothetical protein MGG_15685 [Pyricularia oryzae 70-15]|uniref:Uncharacterized protein n=1 Tax=Pyricularia oryzae (strain 70-15 / ATCC MYA-4617 / FGSC 8958) TaxID=242507 RepID=G4MZ42_PYRO7|nr:uncharacterized protein MGG_15685 [Pyricularia oryzae 70-15]EHA54509.1 hypothetical protein MGG_15685 [Pyricularia oryzae 70-15]
MSGALLRLVGLYTPTDGGRDRRLRSAPPTRGGIDMMAHRSSPPPRLSALMVLVSVAIVVAVARGGGTRSWVARGTVAYWGVDDASVSDVADAAKEFMADGVGGVSLARSVVEADACSCCVW